MPNKQVAELRHRGYLVIRNAVSRSVARRLSVDLSNHCERTPFGSGAFYGNRTKRFGRLLLRSSQSIHLVMHERILAIAEAILLPACERIQLNTTQAIQIHPGEGQQFPHRDDAMWRLPPSSAECLVNVMWPLCSFNQHNGGTMLWPKTDAQQPDPGRAIVPDVEPGDALVFLGSTYHCGGANCSDAPRLGLVIGYSLGWLRQHENQYLAYSADEVARFPDQLRSLIGYSIHRPNLGNFEGQCPSVALSRDRDRPLAAVDYLSAEHESLLEDFAFTSGGEREGIHHGY
jgi:ectoine hydroxylase-related dioxygenase (phytanoyl-CoA dioxygenase family)